MSIDYINFVLFVALVCYNVGIQAYIHFEAYPLFRNIPQDNFAAYVAEYERRLTIPLLAPYGLTVLSNIGVIALGPSGASVIVAIIALILNLSIAGITLRVATPVYERVKTNGAAGDDFAQLMKINMARLGVSVVVAVIVLLALLDLLV